MNELLYTRSGDLWLATSAGITVLRRDGTVEPIHSAGDQPLDIVTGLHEDADGGIWVSSGAGFPGAWRLHGGRWRHYGVADGLHAQRVHRIAGDRRGRVWFLGISDVLGVNEPGAFVFDGQTIEAWGPEQGLLGGRVYAFAEGPRGELWFGTSAGLSRFDAGSWTYWTRARGLRSDRVFSLACAPDGRLWFGHDTKHAGLGYLDERGRPHYLEPRDGLVHPNVRDLDLGPEGRLWITTDAGLGAYRDGTFVSFRHEQGLDHSNLWPVHSTEDRVYVGTSGSGLRVLSLDETSNPPPRVDVTCFPNGDSARFQWSPAAYRGELAPEQIETRYRLDADPWSRWSTAHELQVLNLAPGTHTLQVQAKGLFGAVDEPGSFTTFRIPHPVYRHPAFLALSALALAAAAALTTAAWRRRRHDCLLRASEERHRSLVEAVPLCIHEIDLEGRLTSMNPAGLRMLGLTDESTIVGADYCAFVGASDRERISTLFAQALAGQTSEFEFRAEFQGEERTLKSSFVPFRAPDGRVIKLMGYSLDVTDERRAEEHRRQLQQQLHLAQKRWRPSASSPAASPTTSTTSSRSSEATPASSSRTPTTPTRSRRAPRKSRRPTTAPPP